MTNNVDAIYHEYPFLNQFVTRLRVTHAQVERFDLAFLGKLSREDGPKRAVIIRRILFLNTLGKQVARVGGKFPIITVSETVREAIIRIDGSAAMVRYALELRNTPGGRGTSGATREVTLYKLPRDSVSAYSWFRSTYAEDLMELRELSATTE